MPASALSAPATRRPAAPPMDLDVLSVALTKVHALLELMVTSDREADDLRRLAGIALDDLGGAETITESIPRAAGRRGRA